MIKKYFKKKNWRNSGGFTLIELVVVMAMIGIVSSASLKLVKFSEINKSLTLTTAEIKGIFRTAQTLALAPPIIADSSDKVLHICGFVVKNDSPFTKLQIMTVLPVGNDPVVCRTLDSIGAICDNGTTTCELYEEKEFGTFTIKGPASAVKTFFRAPYGKVIGEGDIIIQQIGGSGSRKTIEINKQGKINVQ